MNSGSIEHELAEPHMRDMLAMAGLDVEYVRAEGNTLYLRDANGAEIPVLDYAGGYGSLLFGHNHPEIIARARELLDGRIPMHAQFSRNAAASELARELNRILHREFGTDEPYFAVFGNSGAEAVEAAVKHAELDRVMHIAELQQQIALHCDQVRATVRQGDAVVAGTAKGATNREQAARLERLIAELSRANEEVAARPPRLLALEGGFHGKLMGSVQLTHNDSYRTPFKRLAAQAEFIPYEKPEVLQKIAAEPAMLRDIIIEDGTVRVTERPFPEFCALLLEPIQGEGGINPISTEFAREVERFRSSVDCPVIIDEIQSGMGRTGALLASSHIGLRGDYYALAKTLGGGISKASVMLVCESRYRPHFELVHSSTFAKDGFSCQVALKVLQLLEADGGQAYRQAAERGEALRSMLEQVHSAFPDVVKDVRGVGLMLGLQLRDMADSPAPAIGEWARAGLLGYVLSGFLLQAHRIRTFPTASAPNTLRFEPSIYLTDEEIGRLRTALEDLCTILRHHSEERLAQSAG
jgi:acetylornithine/succinyldiaminopimelate/putrescine aminotransferase